MAKVVYAKVLVHNMPEKHSLGFVVARMVDGELWYYGVYDTQERAEEVAEKLGNGVWFQAI